MPDCNRKLPAIEKLARDVANGMTAAQIALRYKTTQDYVRRQLKLIAATPCLPAVRRPEPCGIPYIVVDKKVTAAEYGGTMIQQIRLPRIAMHVAAMEDTP